jgi:hypothetical protein
MGYQGYVYTPDGLQYHGSGIVLPSTLTHIGDACFSSELGYIQIRDMNVDNLTIGRYAFGAYPFGYQNYIYADTQEMGEKFRSKLPEVIRPLYEVRVNQ